MGPLLTLSVLFFVVTALQFWMTTYMVSVLLIDPVVTELTH